MTTRRSILALVVLASSLAACGDAPIGSAETLDCACAQPAPATTSATPAAVVVPAAPQAPAVPTVAPAIQPAVTRAEPTRPIRLSGNADVRSANALRVHRIVLARGVVNRTPVDPADRFTFGPDDRLYTWVEVENAGADTAELVFTWIPPQGAARGGQTLDVPSARRWRTWAFTRQARTPGEWTAEVRTTDGQLLARQTFTVEAPEAPANVIPRS